VAIGASDILAAPLETDRPFAVRNLVSGGVLLALGFVFALVIVVTVVSNRSGNVRDQIGLALVCPSQIILISLVPVVLGAIGARRRSWSIHPKTTLPSAMEPLRKIRWPARRRVLAGAPGAVRTRSDNGCRAVVDLQLADWAAAAPRPSGLVEPVALRAARPVGGCRTSFNLIAIILLALIVGPILLSIFSRGFNSALGIAVTLIFLVFLLLVLGRSIAQLPSMQRRLADVPLVSHWARSGLRGLGAVAGPGWVRCGDGLWQADRDLLLIRRRGRHSPETSLEVMLAGAPGRLRFVVAGVDDPMLARLWSAWMCPEVRPDLAASELAEAAR